MIKYILTTLLIILTHTTNAADPVRSKEKIGIISGAGPMAGCKLCEKIIKICQQNYYCKDDKDFPEILIISYPFSDMLTVLERQANKERLRNELQKCFDRLIQEDIKISAIACNTLHTILPQDITTTLNFVHIVENTFTCAKQKNLKKLLILGTQTTLGLNLYSCPFIESIIPNFEDQIIINRIINNILEGNIDLSDAESLREIIRRYFHLYSIDGVILGCTELPLLHEEYSLSIDDPAKKIIVLDTLEVLAEEIVKRSFGL